MSGPGLLIIRSNSSSRRFQNFCATNLVLRQNAIARTELQETVSLEPKSVPCHMIIVRAGSVAEAKRYWEESDKSYLEETPLALVAEGIPDEGLPPDWDFLPTHKNVEKSPSQPPSLMLIEGSVTEEGPIDQYRDIIMPMLKERGAYYLVYTLADGVSVLSGEWSEQFLALSRWPARHLAYDFWLSDEYQEKAIPTRLNAGTFSVLLFDGVRDD